MSKMRYHAKKVKVLATVFGKYRSNACLLVLVMRLIMSWYVQNLLHKRWFLVLFNVANNFFGHLIVFKIEFEYNIYLRHDGNIFCPLKLS